jgi:hypothetical protein
MRGALVLLMVAGCASRATAPPADPPANVAPSPPSGGATCADSIIDTTRAVDMPASNMPTNYRLGTSEIVGRAIRKRLPTFQLCYLIRLKDQPDLRGRVTARFRVQKSGRPVNIHTFGFDAEIDRCVCERLSALTFGSFDQDETAEYAFLFSPGA